MVAIRTMRANRRIAAMTDDGTEREVTSGLGTRTQARSGASESTRLILLVARLLFIALVLATPALVVASRTGAADPFRFSTVLGLTLATGALGLIVVVVDAMTPNKRLASIFGVYIGLCLGLVGAFAFGTLLNSIVQEWDLKGTAVANYFDLAKVSVGLILCYLAVSVVMTTKDDFRLIIPYVEFRKQNRGVAPMVLDTSALIDGRIVELSESGALDATFIIVQPVIDELQTLSDSADKGKRARGRRGLDIIARMQASNRIDLSIEDVPLDAASVDRGLVEYASVHGYRVVTTDTGLTKVGEIAGVVTVNINRIAGAMRAHALTGDRLELELTRVGENPTQGVGHLPDGTMVVVEGAAAKVGTTAVIVVTNALTTGAGRMLFARLDETPAEAGSAASMASRATAQPKHREGAPPRDGDEPRASARNPRRS